MPESESAMGSKDIAVRRSPCRLLPRVAATTPLVFAATMLVAAEQVHWVHLTGLNCIGTVVPDPALQGGAERLAGGLNDCKARCIELGCVAFVRLEVLAGATDAGDGRMCYFRYGQLEPPERHQKADFRDCHIPLGEQSACVRVLVSEPTAVGR